MAAELATLMTMAQTMPKRQLKRIVCIKRIPLIDHS